MRIADVPGMHEHRALAVVNDQLSVAEAAAMMAGQGIGAVVALKDGGMSGIFTERDLLVKVAAAGLDAATTPVAAVMTVDVATITASRSEAESPAIASALRAAAAAMPEVVSASSAKCRRSIPERVRIHSSVVSRRVSNSAFSTTRAGR